MSEANSKKEKNLFPHKTLFLKSSAIVFNDSIDILHSTI